MTGQIDGEDVAGRNHVHCGIARKAFQGPMWEVWSCAKVYSGGNLSLGLQCPNPVHPAMATKKLVSFRAHRTCGRPTWLLDPQGCMCSGKTEKTHEQMGQVMVIEEEGESFFSPLGL